MNKKLLNAISEIKRLSFDLMEEAHREKRVVSQAALIAYLGELEADLSKNELVDDDDDTCLGCRKTCRECVDMLRNYTR